MLWQATVSKLSAKARGKNVPGKSLSQRMCIKKSHMIGQMRQQMLLAREQETIECGSFEQIVCHTLGYILAVALT